MCGVLCGMAAYCVVGLCIVLFKGLNSVCEGQAHELYDVVEGPEHPNGKWHAYFNGFNGSAWRTLLYTYGRMFIIDKHSLCAIVLCI